MPPRPRPGLQPVPLNLDQADRDRLDAIARALAARDGTIPSRVRVVRWALRELAARLHLAGQTRGAAPVHTPPGPITEPPAP